MSSSPKAEIAPGKPDQFASSTAKSWQEIGVVGLLIGNPKSAPFSIGAIIAIALVLNGIALFWVGTRKE